MPATSKNEQSVIHQNISYYDEIAYVYDQVMDADSSNLLVREKVQDKLNSVLSSGRVIDFGGGTGLDLQWLSRAGYQVIFCEPSEPMRQKAKLVNNSGQVEFLETAQTDFTQWQTQPPAFEKADALIANFGVINYIPGIELLFQNLSLVLKPGAHVLLVILKLSFRKRLRWHRRNALKTLLTGAKFVMYIFHGKQRQTVFVHTEKDIRKASAAYFNFHDSDPVTGFSLIHLTRK